MRHAISLVLSAGLALASPVALAAEPQPQTDVRVVQLQTIFSQAQERVDRFNATRDSKHLVVARELLAQWLVDHQALYGDSKEAVAQRATIEQQIAMIDDELARLSTTSTATPAPMPVPAPVAVAPAPAPAPALNDPARVEQERRAGAWIKGGASMLTLGLVTMLAVSVPLWALRDSALRKADEQTFRADQERYFERAERRQLGAVVTLSVGAPLAAIGATLVTVGMIKRSQARRLSLTPQAGPTYGGATLRLRF